MEEAAATVAMAAVEAGVMGETLEAGMVAAVVVVVVAMVAVGAEVEAMGEMED